MGLRVDAEPEGVSFSYSPHSVNNSPHKVEVESLVPESVVKPVGNQGPCLAVRYVLLTKLRTDKSIAFGRPVVPLLNSLATIVSALRVASSKRSQSTSSCPRCSTFQLRTL